MSSSLLRAAALVFLFSASCTSESEHPAASRAEPQATTARAPLADPSTAPGVAQPSSTAPGSAAGAAPEQHASAEQPSVAPPESRAGAAAAAPSAPAPAAVATAADEQDDEPTGKSLYARHCAGCHNDNGDGKGATMLQQGKQARSFAQGGFAFGNTVEQISKTIASGIPGSSPMQAFKSVMDEDERKLVAEYVLTLTPYKAEKKAADSVFVVSDRAAVARGKLPALHEGGSEFPRGLMIGLPDGLSFEYRVDDVRLLAVRRGGFVDRTDWNERGGGELQPLGEVVFEWTAPDLQPWISTFPPPGSPIGLALAATRVNDDGTATLELEPKPGAPRGIVRISETVFQPHFSSGTAFGRRIEIEREAGAPDFLVSVAAMPKDQLARDIRTHIGKGQGDVVSIVLKHGGRFDCVLAKVPPNTGFGAAEVLTLLLHADDVSTSPRKELTLVVVDLDAWDESLVQRLAEELFR